MQRNFNKLQFVPATLAIMAMVFFAASAHAAFTPDVVTFNVEDNFDAGASPRIEAILVKSTDALNFYVDKKWWDGQNATTQQEVQSNLDALSVEFSSKIYPTLTSVYGQEWVPGVDGDRKITVLFHAMKEGVAGYFRSSDEYIKLQVPVSNEREMVYLSLENIFSSQLKVFLAHEFTHVIEFNQKDRLRGVQEETWLNEGRADYAPTILGYDNVVEGSNLQKRMKDFSGSPSDPITEWKDSKYDYASVSMFLHYLVDHYSVAVLADSLRSKSIGIASLNEALAKNGSEDTFSDIFTNWTIATLVNDCSLGANYCYLFPALKNFKVNPNLNFLPLSGSSSLSVSNVIKNWSGNWQKIIGGNGDLRLDFESLPGLKFQVPYIIVDKNNAAAIRFLTLDSKQKGQITVPEFGSKFSSLIILPSLQSKMSGFGDQEATYPYTFKVSINGAPTDENQELISQLLAQIETLKKQIAALQAGQNNSCLITTNLYFGLYNNAQVICLQQFLTLQGPAIYPEGLTTGTFGGLTKAAVTRFQTQYGIPTTGFVGPLTRAKIQALKGQ